MSGKTWWIVILIIIVALVSYTTISITGNSIWGWNYCTSAKPCPAGIGDCENGADCLTGYCAQDVGVKYGKKAKMDVCEVKP